MLPWRSITEGRSIIPQVCMMCPGCTWVTAYRAERMFCKIILHPGSCSPMYIHDMGNRDEALLPHVILALMCQVSEYSI